jgi:tetratricopeptide (TPR) repeat protein
MLADAYRQSAQQLRDNPPVDAPRERTAEETRARLRRAAELFGAIVAAADAARRDAALDPLDAAYERLALMHLGDCLLELNEIESLSDALALFRQVAARYQGDAIALTAQVQIANIYLRMGRTIEAARAVERARWLLNATPDEALAASPDGFTRAEWDRFLTAVAQADVFGDVFTAAN